MRISRRGLLKASAAFSLSLLTGGAGALLSRCSQLPEEESSSPLVGGTTTGKAVPDILAGFAPIDTRGTGARPFTLSTSTMRWLINGRRFEMDKTLFNVERNSVEVWKITNDAASMPYPMHLHGFQSQVLGRRNRSRQIQVLAVDQEMRPPTDLGRKDTVLVWPGETARIAVDFGTTFPGDQTYLFHCHNLEHEDMGTMVNYQIVQGRIRPGVSPRNSLTGGGVVWHQCRIGGLTAR